MSMRYLGGFITASYNPLKVPNAPTIGTVTAGNAQVSVAFTAPSNVGGGAITSYTVLSSGGQTASGASSPIVVTGLTNGVSYTFQAFATNSYGPSAFSATSGSATPYAPKLYAWGRNNNGQLGQGNLIARSSPVQVGALTNWSLVAIGAYTTFSVKTDGTLWSWGYNGYGQLGLNLNNATSYINSPTQVGALTTWLLASAGYYATLAIKTDGTLWSWGGNNHGQLGQNNRVNRSSPVQVGAGTTWSKVAGSSYQTLAVKSDGTLWSWGANSTGALGQNDTVTRSSPVQVGALTDWNIVEVSKNTTTSWAIKTDGTLWGWGRNPRGELGQNNTIYRSSPTQVGSLTNWSKVSAGYANTMAVKTDGTLWSWGDNTNGQLCQNDLVRRSSPTQVGALTTWLDVKSGLYFTLAIKTDGTIWACGRNDDGQLGKSDTVYRSSPVQIGSVTSWAKITAGTVSSYGIAG